ncbi:hypothetical protein ACFUN8_25795 [Streptomyces sp. NPDC057307]|uniref:hypothetical protein n=1 Tax=Streptomyces sp. NPDC057307 TaxID=3346096 RepID=UPI00362AF9CF
MAERVRPPLLVAPSEPTGPLAETGVGGPGDVLPGSVSRDGSADLTVTVTVRAAARDAAGRERVNAFRAHHFTALGCRPADSTR